MTTDTLADWARANPTPAILAATLTTLLTAAALWATARALRTTARPPAAVLVAALAAMACTAYSADTSWRFAEHRLGMTDTTERAAMFAAAELALFATALMARQNLRQSGAPGTPGALVWVITSVQIIPAYAESGFWGGTVRAFIGPILAALLWHLAMGLELRHVRPGALSSGTLAVIGRDLRERLLSHLGVATRNRTAEQITRDRATARAVRLAARPRLRAWGRRRLAAAVARAQVGINGEQRHQLLQQLAARRSAADLATMALPSPWTADPAPAPYPSTPLGVTGAQLRGMDPVDAVCRVHAAHPYLTPAEIAALCTAHGVVVSTTQVRIALRTQQPHPVQDAGDQPVLEAVPEPDPEPGPGLVLDLAPTPSDLHPEVRPRTPVLAASAQLNAVHARVEKPEPSTPAPDPLLPAVRALVAAGRSTSIRTLKREFRIGQPRAQALLDQLAKEA